jgi:hypothetical protein
MNKLTTIVGKQANRRKTKASEKESFACLLSQKRPEVTVTSQSYANEQTNNESGTYRLEQIGQTFRLRVDNHRVNVAAFDVEQNLSKVVRIAFAKHKLDVFRQSRRLNKLL